MEALHEASLLIDLTGHQFLALQELVFHDWDALPSVCTCAVCQTLEIDEHESRFPGYATTSSLWHVVVIAADRDDSPTVRAIALMIAMYLSDADSHVMRAEYAQGRYNFAERLIKPLNQSGFQLLIDMACDFRSVG